MADDTVQKQFRFRKLRSITRISLWSKLNLEAEFTDTPNHCSDISTSKEIRKSSSSSLYLSDDFQENNYGRKANDQFCSSDRRYSCTMAVGKQVASHVHLTDNEPGAEACVRSVQIQVIDEKRVKDRCVLAYEKHLCIAKKSKHVVTDTVLWDELWIYDVQDGTPFYSDPVTNVLLIGWATRLLLLKFFSYTDKNSWRMYFAERQLSSWNMALDHFTLKPMINVKFHDKTTSITRKMVMKEQQTIRDIADNMFNKLNVSECDRPNFDSLVEYGKYHRLHLLSGYEQPLALLIHMSRISVFANDCTNRETVDNGHCQLNFVLKRRMKMRSKSFSFDCKKPEPPSSNVVLHTESNSRGHTLMKRFKNKMLSKMALNDGSTESTFSARESPVPNLTRGHFFSVPLTALSADGRALPKSLEEILSVIYDRGALLEGIFRKSPNLRRYKEVRDALDNGYSLNTIDGLNPIICSSLLKEFLRLLPDPLFGRELLYRWRYYLENSSEHSELVVNAKKLISDMNPLNRTLLCHLIYLLHHIVEKEDVNFMNITNLSICLTPNLLKICENAGHLKDESSSRTLMAVIQLLTESCDLIFDGGKPSLFRTCVLNRPSDSVTESSCGFGSMENLKQSTESLQSVFGYNRHSLNQKSAVWSAISKDSGLGGSRDLCDDELPTLFEPNPKIKEPLSDKLTRKSSSLRRNSDSCRRPSTSRHLNCDVVASVFRRQSRIRKSLCRKSFIGRYKLSPQVTLRRRRITQKAKKIDETSTNFIDEKKQLHKSTFYGDTKNSDHQSVNEKTPMNFNGTTDKRTLQKSEQHSNVHKKTFSKFYQMLSGHHFDESYV